MRQAKTRNLIFLFDLESDPNETENLADLNKTIMKLLMKKIRTIMNSGKVVKPDTPFLMEKSLPKYFNGIFSPGWCKAN